MMALAMILSLSATAFAAEDTGSITITNATIGDTYKLYKIFDAAYDGTAVTYSITETLTGGAPNAIFVHMFGADGQTANPYFNYASDTGRITRIDGTNNEDIEQYLTDMIRAGIHNGVVTEIADASRLVFDDLSFGYYLIDKDSTGEVAVTIDSNTPNAEVIDKNQKPGTNFDKKINEDGVLVENNTAFVGSLIDYQISFDATNYDGEFQIQYYAVKDNKGDGLWAEFDSIRVFIYNADGTLHKELTKGFYFNAGDSALDTGEWADGLGNWGGATVSANAAEWYLVHKTYDEFLVVIPWLSDYTFTGGNGDFKLEYGEDAESLYPSPAKVVITYDAYVEYDAEIGILTGGDLWKKADLAWYYDGGDDGPPNIPSTNTTTFALGLTKVDADDATKHLAGAVFQIYADAAHTKPVYVIPTDVEGVYIVDDYGIGNNVSGDNMISVRERYAAHLDAYLNGATQKNEVVTPANGKIVVLGLEEGTYYLDETQAPDGYNDLSGDFEITVSPDVRKSFVVIVDQDNKAVDLQDASDANHTKYEYVVTPGTVTNSKGVELPSTGGTGRFMLISIGSMIAMGFAILLITQKKMSAYTD